MAVIGVDLDGVLCSEERTFERSLATLEPGALEFTKDARQQGHTVIIWTARGWEQYRLTIDWLVQHGVEFDQLIMGKPIFDVFIDDRAIGHTSWPSSRKELSRKGFLN
jgi:uncharacterized HAD superfamily protein